MNRTIFAASCMAMFCLLNNHLFATGADAASATTDNSLSKLETRFFEHQYGSDSDEDRISRIEQFVFGCTQTGNISTRLQHIQATIPDSAADQINNAPSVASSNSPDTVSASSDDTATAPQKSEDTSSDSTQYSSYPRVTTLEQEILGHTYETDTLNRRLSRLETKAFGNIASDQDLGDRVDNLDDYAQRHDLYGDRKIATNSPSPLTFAPKRVRPVSDVNSVYPSDVRLKRLATNSTSETQSTGTSFVGSMEERVAMMEAQEFDHTYPEKPLDKRLKKLEKKILPNQDDSQLGLFERTSKLWIVLHPSDKNKPDALIASNQSVINPTNKNNNDTLIANNESSTKSTYNPNSANSAPDSTNNAASKRGSWLHRLADQMAVGTNANGPNTSNGAAVNGYPYPGSFYVPSSAVSPNSRFIGGSFGPGSGPGGLPVGFW